jgi:hypothetical protein
MRLTKHGYGKIFPHPESQVEFLIENSTYISSMPRPYEKPELVPFSTASPQQGLGRGQCETGFGYNSGNCTTGWIAYKTCTSGPWAANANCDLGANASSTTYRQCCTGGTPSISNLACTSGVDAGKSCSTGTNYLNYNCS